MTKQQIDQLEQSLFEFVKRASSREATVAEVEALPVVVQSLANLVRAINQGDGVKPWTT